MDIGTYLREKLVNQTFVAFIFYTIHIISTKAQKFEEILKMPGPNQNYSAVNANTGNNSYNNILSNKK